MQALEELSFYSGQNAFLIDKQTIEKKFNKVKKFLLFQVMQVCSSKIRGLHVLDTKI